MMIPELGSHVFVRTLSDHWVGKVEEADTLFVKLSGASWVADSGRLGEFVRNGRTEQMEIEVVRDVLVRYETIIAWNHPLFTEDV